MKFSVTGLLTIACLLTEGSASLIAASVHETAEAESQLATIQQMMEKMQTRLGHQQKMRDQIKELAALMDKTSAALQEDDSSDSDSDADVQLSSSQKSDDSDSDADVQLADK